MPLCLHHGKLGSVRTVNYALFLTTTSTDSTSYRLLLKRRNFFTGHHRPCLISFNNTAIVRNFYLDVYQRRFLKICHQSEGNLRMTTFDYKPRSTRSQAYHSDCNVTELINQILLIIYTPSKPQEMI